MQKKIDKVEINHFQSMAEGKIGRSPMLSTEYVLDECLLKKQMST